MVLNQYGQAAYKYWLDMPNHIHGIVIVGYPVGTEQCSVPTFYKRTNRNIGLLSKIIKSYKNVVTSTMRYSLNNIQFFWQRSFYDHIIRSEESLNTIRQYIRDNPRKRDEDENKIENFSNKDHSTLSLPRKR